MKHLASVLLSLVLASGSAAQPNRNEIYSENDAFIQAPADIRQLMQHALASCRERPHYFCRDFAQHIKDAAPLVLSSDFVFVNCPTRVSDKDLCDHARDVYTAYMKRAGLMKREIAVSACVLSFQFFYEDEIMKLRHWTVKC